MLKRFETFIANCQLNDQRSIFVDQLFSEKKKNLKKKRRNSIISAIQKPKSTVYDKA